MAYLLRIPLGIISSHEKERRKKKSVKNKSQLTNAKLMTPIASNTLGLMMVYIHQEHQQQHLSNKMERQTYPSGFTRSFQVRSYPRSLYQHGTHDDEHSHQRCSHPKKQKQKNIRICPPIPTITPSQLKKKKCSPIPEALDSLEMSRCKLNGKLTPTVANRITNVRFNSRESTGTVFRKGKM